MEHIVKGVADLETLEAKLGSEIKVIYTPQSQKDSELGYHNQGIIPVSVETGALVLVYLDPSATQPGFFEPILEGLLIISIQHSEPLE